MSPRCRWTIKSAYTDTLSMPMLVATSTLCHSFPARSPSFFFSLTYSYASFPALDRLQSSKRPAVTLPPPQSSTFFPCLAPQHRMAELSFLLVRGGENRGARVVMEPQKPALIRRLTRAQMTSATLYPAPTLKSLCSACTFFVFYVDIGLLKKDSSPQTKRQKEVLLWSWANFESPLIILTL